jgi:hypothetical protein
MDIQSILAAVSEEIARQERVPSRARGIAKIGQACGAAAIEGGD